MAKRQVMGHHLDRPSTSALTYGRQNFIPILVKVAVLLKRIVNDNFNPDAQPSRIVRQALLAMEEESNGYWSQMGMPVGMSESEDSPTTTNMREGMTLKNLCIGYGKPPIDLDNTSNIETLSSIPFNFQCVEDRNLTSVFNYGYPRGIQPC